MEKTLIDARYDNFLIKINITGLISEHRIISISNATM